MDVRDRPQFLLGLFGLASKTPVLSGPALVTIYAGGQMIQVQELVGKPADLQWLLSKVTYCQQLAAQARTA